MNVLIKNIVIRKLPDLKFSSKTNNKCYSQLADEADLRMAGT